MDKNKETKETPLFEDNSQAVMQRRDETAVARAVQEVQAALVIAQRFPRDEVRARQRILDACKRKGLAEVSEYEFSRGGTNIVGPTIDLLRAIASRWGNIDFGWKEEERFDGQSSVRAWAWDMQSGARAHRTWIVKHWRDTRQGGYKLDDERDVYELIANSAARRVRACLEEIIDSDIVTDAIDQCRETLRTGEKSPLIDQVTNAVGSFAAFDVTLEEIERWAGRKAMGITFNQLASLRRIYKALKDGVGKKEDYFKPEVKKPEFGTAPVAPDAPVTAPASEEAAPAEPAAKEKPAESKPAPLVTAVRGLLKTARISEGFLLNYLAKEGLTDGSVGSLEELALRFQEPLKMVHDRWVEVLPKLREANV